MAEHPPETGASAYPRERTATRMRFVAPPGMALSESHDSEKIGRYEIIETLGKGAMGVVYKARDPLLDRIVAVKTIVSPKHGGRRVRKAYLERFEREAKAAAKMQHPAIVTIFDVGTTDDGAPFMVLEYLPGESLADRCDRVRMPLSKAVQVGIDLASALGFAHKMRIVHRDVKPANVLHAGENRWKLADFGIARMPDSDLTQVGIFMGTPGYAPVEAIKNGRYTPQADVFAWGAVLYELLSGRIAYEGPDTQTTNSYVIKNTAPPPTHYDPSIPEPLSETVMRALHPDPEVRFDNGSEAEQALQKAWERCLSSNLVSPSVLVAQEVPHSRAPRAFHKPQVADAPEQATPRSVAAGPPTSLPVDFNPGIDQRPDRGEASTVQRGEHEPAFGAIEQAINSELQRPSQGGGGADFNDLDAARTIPDGNLAALDQHGATGRSPIAGLGTLETTALDRGESKAEAPDDDSGRRIPTGRVVEAGAGSETPRPSVWVAVIIIALLAGTAAAYVLLKL